MTKQSRELHHDEAISGKRVPVDACGNTLPLPKLPKEPQLICTRLLLETPISALRGRRRTTREFPDCTYPLERLPRFEPQITPRSEVQLPGVSSMPSDFFMPFRGVGRVDHVWSQWEIDTLNIFVPSHNWFGAQARLPYLTYDEIRNKGEIMSKGEVARLGEGN